MICSTPPTAQSGPFPTHTRTPPASEGRAVAAWRTCAPPSPPAALSAPGPNYRPCPAQQGWGPATTVVLWGWRTPAATGGPMGRGPPAAPPSGRLPTGCCCGQGTRTCSWGRRGRGCGERPRWRAWGWGQVSRELQDGAGGEGPQSGKVIVSAGRGWWGGRVLCKKAGSAALLGIW